MKDHPLTPMRVLNLMRPLAPQVTGDVGLVDRLSVARGLQLCVRNWRGWPVMASLTWSSMRLRMRDRRGMPIV
jgi:hypothetical protein